MKMTERFTRAYNALVKAYFEGTLLKGDPCGCACGNIIANSLGQKVEIRHGKTYKCGVTAFCVEDNDFWHAPLFPDEYIYAHEMVPKLTGYSFEEFMKIESAFETNTRISHRETFEYSEQEILEDQYNGLSAVVDVMLELDGVTKTDNSFNEKFREHPKLQKI